MNELSRSAPNFNIVNFNGAVFYYVPNLQNTIFDNSINLFDVQIPKNPPSEQLENTYYITERYRWLKKMAEQAKDNDKRLYFFAAEMRAKLRDETIGWAKIPNFLYGLVSDYGGSIMRPLIGLGITWGFGVGALSLLVNRFDWRILELSLSYLLPNLFTGELSTDSEKAIFSHRLEEVSLCLSRIESVESFMGAIFFFFLALALRNRFLIR